MTQCNICGEPNGLNDPWCGCMGSKVYSSTTAVDSSIAKAAGLCAKCGEDISETVNNCTCLQAPYSKTDGPSVSRSECQYCGDDHGIFMICNENPNFGSRVEPEAVKALAALPVAVDVSSDGDFTAVCRYKVINGTVYIQEISYGA